MNVRRAGQEIVQTGRKAVKQSVGYIHSLVEIDSIGEKVKFYQRFAKYLARARARVTDMPGALDDFRLASRFSASVFSISIVALCDHGRRDNWTVNPAFDILTHEIA